MKKKSKPQNIPQKPLDIYRIKKNRLEHEDRLNQYLGKDS